MRAEPSPETWQDHYNAFKKLLPTVSNAHSPSDIFRDVCRIFSLSLRGWSAARAVGVCDE